MNVPTRHVLRQGPVVRAFVRTAARALTGAGAEGAPEVPGPALEAIVPPRPPELVRDFVRWSGGSPSAWRGVLPPHLFSQWGFPLLARTLDPVPYDLTRVVNAGVRMEIRRPLPDDEPLHLSARLASVDDDGRRAILAQELVTGTASAPDALVSTLFVHVPTGPRTGGGKRRERPRVPLGARPIGHRRFSADAGLEYGVLTGDFNPVHWLGPYARAAGFRHTILQGFGTLSFCFEALVRSVFAGDPSRLASIEVRFTRPLVLPGQATAFVDDRGGVFVGAHPGGPAYLVGTCTQRPIPEDPHG